MSIKEEVLEVKQELKEVKEKGFAMEILSDYKKTNKRMFIILITVLCMWFATIGYLVYILNDIGVIEETTYEQEVTDIDSIGGSITNSGDIYGEDKANN